MTQDRKSDGAVYTVFNSFRTDLPSSDSECPKQAGRAEVHERKAPGRHLKGSVRLASVSGTEADSVPGPSWHSCSRGEAELVASCRAHYQQNTSSAHKFQRNAAGDKTAVSAENAPTWGYSQLRCWHGACRGEAHRLPCIRAKHVRIVSAGPELLLLVTISCERG